MNGDGKSDRRVVPKKPANKEAGALASAESVEGRGLAKGNAGQQNRHRAQNRESLQNEFGRFAASNRSKRGDGKPETFEFLGFTHICATKRNGRFVVRRKTSRTRMRRKLQALKVEFRRRLHHNPHEVGRWIRSVLQGHYRYYGVPLNYRELARFQLSVEWMWYRALRRRSQRQSLTWPQMRRRLTRHWIPRPRIYHPWPNQRLLVRT